MMKKKLISGLLLMALFGAGAISMTSCKDTDDDLYTELSGNQVALGAELDRLAGQLAQCGINCQNKIAALEQDIKNNTYTKVEINQKFDELNNLYAKKSQVDEIQTVIDYLKSIGLNNMAAWEVSNLKGLAASHGEILLASQLASSVEQLKALAEKKDELLALLNGGAIDVPNINPLEDAVFGPKGEDGKRKGGLLDRVSGIEGYFKMTDKDGNETVMTIEDFQKAIKNGLALEGYTDALKSVVDHLQKDGALNTDALDALNTYADRFQELVDMYDDVFNVENNPLPEGETKWWSYGDVMKRILANEEAIEKLTKQIDSLLKRFNDLVTGLVLQGTENPVFGSFNTPFGFNSMVLMTYFGKSNPINFPAEAVEDAGDKTALTGVASTTFDGMLYNDVLGKLYFTVNPVGANVNYDGFVIENSVGTPAPVTLAAVPSDKELSFGINTRSAENGFYETAVTLDATPLTAEDALSQIKVHIEPGLVDALKSAVKNHTMSDVASLAKVVYKNLQNVCTANALRYNWETMSDVDAEGNLLDAPAPIKNSVLSQYGLAVTAVKPLSFLTLRNQTIDRELPVFGDITLDKSLVDMKFDPFKIENINLKIELKLDGFYVNEVSNVVVKVKVPAKFDTNKLPDGTFETVLPDNWANMEGYYKYVETPIDDQLNEVVKKLQQSVNEWVHGNGADKEGIEKQINNAIKKAVDDAFNGENGLVAKIQDQVNSMTGKIQDKLYQLVDQINNDYLNRLNKIIGKYNSLAEKINARLKNPNHYLQVAMLYQNSAGGVSLLSNSSKSYSPFTVSDGGEGISLWATTYNFETLCPVYKKYVAVTNIKVDGVDSNDASLLAKANEGMYMNQILEGYTKEVVLKTKDVVEPGHTYAFEITYRALDYHGFTSTSKYYIVVDAKN